MQTLATRVFMGASILFGVAGVLLIMTSPGGDQYPSVFNVVLRNILITTVFIILSSFALSVAGKYLKDK